MKPNQHFPTALLILIGLALLLRGVGISQRPLWYDEAFSGLYAEKGLPGMLATTLGSGMEAAAEEHPLGYYLLLWGWMRWFGESPFAIRSLSVLVGVITVAVVFFFTRRLFNPRLAIYLTFLAAISPFQVHYSQEVRMYALLALCLLLCTWALWEGMQSNRWGWWLIFSLSAAMAQYVHHLAVFYLAPLALTPLFFRNWRALGRLVIAAGGAILLYLPWLVHLPGQFAKVQEAYWTQPPGLDRLITTLLSFITNLPLPGRWLAGALFISWLLFVLATWLTVKMMRRSQPGWQAGVWLAYLGVVPVCLLFLFSQWRAVYIERGLLASGLVFILWIGWAISEGQAPRLVQIGAGGLLILAAGMGFYQHLTYQGFPYAPFAELDASLKSRVAANEVILHSNKLSLLPGMYYDRTLNQRYLADPPGSGSDTLAKPSQRLLGISASDSIASATGDARRVWFIIFDKAIQEYQANSQATHPHLAWLADHYRLEAIEPWGDLRLYVFTLR